MASVITRFAIAGIVLALISLAGCGGKSQQQKLADERAQIEATMADMAASARIEREHDAQVKRDAAAIVDAHNAAEREENAKAQAAAAAEQARAQEAAASR
jgi:hypothetical protein